MRTIVAIIGLSLSGFLGYVAYALYESTQQHPPGMPAEFTEHLFLIGGVAFRPLVVIGSVGIAASSFFALAVYLLIAARE